MTTIVYHKDILVGDSRNIESNGQFSMSYEKPKIHLSASKDYAYGVDIENLPKDSINFYKQIDNFIEKYLADESYNEEFPIKNVHVLVMTNEKTFTIFNPESLTEEERHKQIIIHPKDSIVAYGSGAISAIVSILNGADIIEGIKDAVLNDFNTGGDIYGVKRSVLKGSVIPNTILKRGETINQNKIRSSSEKSNRRWFN